MATLGPVNFEVGGHKYSCIPHTGMGALNLDRVVTGIWNKVIGNVRASAGTEDEKAERIGKFFDAFSLTLLDMKEEDFERIVVDSFCHTVAIGDGKEKDMKLSDGDTIGDHFADHKGDMNLVLLRIWEANRLSPFE